MALEFMKNLAHALIKLCEFVVKVYASFWFLVKSKPLAICGSRNIFQYIAWIRQLPEDAEQTHHPVIQNNSYFFNPKNVLLSMVTDQDTIVRSDGYIKILLARNDVTGYIRQMFGPQVVNFINFESDSYFYIINWNQFELSEPPFLQFYTQEHLEALQCSQDVIELPAYPSHSAVVVHVSAMAVTDEQRMGHIFFKLESRQKYSQLKSRRDMID